MVEIAGLDLDLNPGRTKPRFLIHVLRGPDWPTRTTIHFNW